MGQYYLIVNSDKKQYLYSHTFGDGLKLMEFGTSACGMLTGLAILLADGNGRGGGDLRSENPLIGSWAGDRIVIAGDYADGDKFVPPDDVVLAHEVDPDIKWGSATLYDVAQAAYKDISPEVVIAMAADDYVRKNLILRRVWAPHLEVPRGGFPQERFYIGGRWVAYTRPTPTKLENWYTQDKDEKFTVPVFDVPATKEDIEMARRQMEEMIEGHRTAA